MGRKHQSSKKARAAKQAAKQAPVLTVAPPCTTASLPCNNSDIIDAGVNSMLQQVLRWSIDGPRDLKESVLVGKFVPNAREQFYLACELGESAVVATLMTDSPECIEMRSKGPHLFSLLRREDTQKYQSFS